MSAFDQAQAIREARKSLHGNTTHNAACTGKQWAAILNEHWPDAPRLPDIPPHVVHLMLAAMKLGRAARPHQKPDNDDYVDALNYVAFAEECAPNVGRPVKRMSEVVDELMVQALKDCHDGPSASAPRKVCDNCGKRYVVPGLDVCNECCEPDVEDKELVAVDIENQGQPMVIRAYCARCGKAYAMIEGSAEDMCPNCVQRLGKMQASVQPLKHVLKTAKDCDCDPDDPQQCPVCDGGLGICKVCGRAESELDLDDGVCLGHRPIHLAPAPTPDDGTGDLYRFLAALLYNEPMDTIEPEQREKAKWWLIYNLPMFTAEVINFEDMDVDPLPEKVQTDMLIYQTARLRDSYFEQLQNIEKRADFFLREAFNIATKEGQKPPRKTMQIFRAAVIELLLAERKVKVHAPTSQEEAAAVPSGNQPMVPKADGTPSVENAEQA